VWGSGQPAPVSDERDAFELMRVHHLDIEISRVAAES
jgi:hypothetical protein